MGYFNWVDNSLFRRLISAPNILLLSALLFANYSVANEGSGCQLAQEKTQPVWSAQCDIGQGVWGKPSVAQLRELSQQGDGFWVQCGFTDKALSPKQVKKLRSLLVANGRLGIQVIHRSQRCLIGPFSDPVKAHQQLSALHAEPLYRDAFIRAIPRASLAHFHPLKTQLANGDAEKEQSLESEKTADSHQDVMSVPAAPIQTVETKALRAGTVINGMEYAIPFDSTQPETLYQTKGQQWHGVNYPKAKEMCYQHNMTLVTIRQWREIVRHGIPSTWPTTLPYWGKNKQALYFRGQAKRQSTSSHLNVVCVR